MKAPVPDFADTLVFLFVPLPGVGVSDNVSDNVLVSVGC